jgi:hypothetical protein
LKRLLLALLLCAGLALASATTASAAPVSHASPTTIYPTGCPDSEGVYYGVCVYYNGQQVTATYAFSCENATYTGFASGITTVGDSCPVRVWEHQDANGDGLTECISPGDWYGPPSGSWQSKPGNIQVTENTSNC